MSSLPVGFGIYYLTQIEGVTWRSTDYDMRNIVRGLKGSYFNGYSDLVIGGKTERYDTNNIEKFVDLLLPAVGKKLSQTLNGKISIVPIPNSAMCVGKKGEFRIVDLAEKLAKGYGSDAEVCPAIRWVTEKERAHKSDEHRDPRVYQPLMRLADKPKHRVVIFDDVLTSGSQMIAAARFMKAKGFDVVHGAVGARVTSEQHNPMMKWRTETIELDLPATDFDVI